MNATLRLLVRFILWTLLLVVVGSLLIVAFRYVVNYNSEVEAASGFLAGLLAGAGQLLVPVILVVSAISLFDLIREEADPRITLPLLFLVWTGALFGAGVLSGVDLVSAQPPVPSLPAERLVRAESAVLYTGSASGSFFEPIVVHDANGFELFRSGRRHEGTATFSVDGRSWELAEFSNTYASTVEPPRGFQGLQSDVVSTAKLMALSGASVNAALHIVGLSLLLLGSWTLVRLTRWPLFNVVGVLLILRFAVWVAPAVHEGPLRSLVVVALSSRALPYVSAGLLGGVGLALFFVSALLPPLQTYKREIAP